LWHGRNSSLLNENRLSSSSVLMQNDAAGSSENIVKVNFLHDNEN
jgi:hypothetical protein